MCTTNLVRLRPRKVLVIGFALLIALCPLWADGDKTDELRWKASTDLITAAPGAALLQAEFRLTRSVSEAVLRLDYQGMSRVFRIPVSSLPSVLPLDGRARLRDPFATVAQLSDPGLLQNGGWNLWDGRPRKVWAAAAGLVLSNRRDPLYGAIVEIDHGSGLRTRYVLNRYGSSDLVAGSRVAAGDSIGILGDGLPDDLSYLHFELLLDLGQGELLSLDPSPFLLGAAANRGSPFAGSLLNAAVRSGDGARVTRLLDLGIDPNGEASDGSLPLEWAILFRNAPLLRLLVEAGGNRDAKTAAHFGRLLEGRPTIAGSGPTIAEYALESGDSELIAALGLR